MVKKILFFSLTITVFVAAWLVSEQKKIKSDIPRNALYPQLMDQLNLISEIKIRSEKKNITVKKKNTSWVLIESDNFPVKPEVVKKVLLQAARLSILENKTKSSHGHRVLGVNALDEDGIPRRKITLRSENSVSFADFIVGKRLDQDRKTRHYVRQSQGDQSWVAEGNLDFTAEPIDWVDSKIIDINPDSIKSIKIVGNSKSSIFLNKNSNSQTFFQLENIPDDRKAKSTTLISSFGSLLSDMRFNSVLSNDRLERKTPIRETTVSTFKNIKIIMKDYLIEQDVYTSFDFEEIDKTNADERKNRLEEIEDYRRKTNQWIYQLPKYKRRIIERKFETLVQPKNKT